MTPTTPALLLVALGVAVVAVGLTHPLAAPSNVSGLAAVLVPARRTLTVACVVGIGSIQMLGGTALLAAGWS